MRFEHSAVTAISLDGKILIYRDFPNFSDTALGKQCRPRTDCSCCNNTYWVLRKLNMGATGRVFRYLTRDLANVIQYKTKVWLLLLLLLYDSIENAWKIMGVKWSQFIFSIGTFGPRQANLVLMAYASSEGPGEPAHPRSLARTFAARSYKQWVKRNLQTESQITGPSEWLGMRSWSLSWRNARRHKFAWRGSFSIAVKVQNS